MSPLPAATARMAQRAHGPFVTGLLMISGMMSGMGPGIAAQQTPWSPSAQDPQAGAPRPPSQPQGQQSGRQLAPQQPNIDRVPQDPLQPTWNRLLQAPRFEGFPVFPSRLSGYGNYPAGTAPGGPPGQQVPFPLPSLPPAGPEVADWPAWARLRDREPLPFTPELALLVRHTDRVWWRRAADEAFVPLFHHDKIAPLGSGGEVQVRQAGEFELLLHSSSRLIAQGPTDLRLTTMTAAAVAIDVLSFTRLRLHVTHREHTLMLPDGTKLVLQPEPPGVELTGPTVVLFDRVSEPAFYGGRATIYNAGPRDLMLESALGETTLSPGHRVTIFLEPPAAPIARTLDLGEAVATQDGDDVRVAVPNGGTVAWSGARFTLPAGGDVRLQPLLGQPFDHQQAARPEKTQ